MKDLTQVEMHIYTKILNNKWDEVEDLITKEDISSPILVLEIFSAKKWDIALKLLKHNKFIDLNKTYKITNDTLLMMAISDNNSDANDVAKFLIDNNAKLDLINKEGLTALMVACKKNNVEMFKYLLKHNDDINVTTHKNTLLMTAIKGGNVEIVSEILKKSNNLNIVIDGENALSFAIKNKRFDIANMLIYQGITIQNQDIIVDYLMDTKDIGLIYYVLSSNNSSDMVKDKIIKALIKVVDIQDLLKVGDSCFRQQVAKIFFNGRHNLEDQKQAIDAFLASDIKDYIKANFKDNIRAFLIDCYVQKQPISYINDIQNECDIQDYPNHFDQIVKSTGMPENAMAICINKYLLILCQQQIYQQNIEDFSISGNELDVIIAYNLINSMGNSEFKESYKEFYFDNILKCDKEVLYRLQHTHNHVMTNLYNWVWGIKDDISDLNKDVGTISTCDLMTYDMDNLEGVKRSNNSQMVKDMLYYVVMSIRYLVDKALENNMTNLNQINNLLGKKDANLEVIQSILKGKGMKASRQINNQSFLSQNQMKWAIDNEYVFVRGICDAYEYVPSSLHNETHIDIELRKGLRIKGQPTLTKKQSDKNGNINRSVTMINFGSRVFGRAGLGFIKKDSDNISLVASRNIGTGKGKKREITRVIKQDTVIDSTKSIKEQLCELSEYLKRGGGKAGHNEVIADVKYPEDVSFIYYSSDGNSQALDFLNAIYIQRKFFASTGERLPIFKIAPDFHYPIKESCTKTKIKQALVEVLSQNTSHILNKNAIDFILCFKDELKNIPECKLKIGQFLKCEVPDNIYETINISRAIGEYQSIQKQNEYLARYTNIFIQKQNFMHFAKHRLAQKNDAKRKNRTIDLYMEIMDEICEILPSELMDNIKSVSQDTFKKVCEYGIKRNDITSMDELLEKCNNRPYLTLDDETKIYIRNIMEGKQKQRRDFFKKYGISL